MQSPLCDATRQRLRRYVMTSSWRPANLTRSPTLSEHRLPTWHMSALITGWPWQLSKHNLLTWPMSYMWSTPDAFRLESIATIIDMRNSHIHINTRYTHVYICLPFCFAVVLHHSNGIWVVSWRPVGVAEWAERPPPVLEDRGIQRSWVRIQTSHFRTRWSSQTSDLKIDTTHTTGIASLLHKLFNTYNYIHAAVLLLSVLATSKVAHQLFEKQTGWSPPVCLLVEKWWVGDG